MNLKQCFTFSVSWRYRIQAKTKKKQNSSVQNSGIAFSLSLSKHIFQNAIKNHHNEEYFIRKGSEKRANSIHAVTKYNLATFNSLWF